MATERPRSDLTQRVQRSMRLERSGKQSRRHGRPYQTHSGERNGGR